jgi:hypothetical protein
MSKIFTWIIAVAAVTAVSDPTYATIHLQNGISSNGISSNGISGNGLNLQAVRLVMPDGTELSLR